jgi:hypothetical protein
MNVTTTLQKGQWVRHSKCLYWGIGKFILVEEDGVHVLFQHAGDRKINLKFVTLEVVEPPETDTYKLYLVRNISISTLERLCSEFHESMKDNRSGSDDGRMGLNVLSDMKERGHLTRSSQKQLFAWCHTEGSVYQAGVDLAQQICRAIYGRVPTRHEIDSL